MTDVTIPYMEKILRDEVPGAEKSHAVDNFRMAAGEKGGSFYGMVFQDSDVAKWLEAAAYSLALKPDEALSRRVDEVVALIGRCQQPDGYLNTYFTVKEPENKWKNLLECHELYCAGHMIEAAAALFEAAGKDRLLRICIRLADHICDRFEKQEGIPGHEEIEIGLLRLYRATGNPRYRDMAMRFLNLRGQDPEWFRKHTPRTRACITADMISPRKIRYITSRTCRCASRQKPGGMRFVSCICSPPWRMPPRKQAIRICWMPAGACLKISPKGKCMSPEPSALQRIMKPSPWTTICPLTAATAKPAPPWRWCFLPAGC